MFHDSLIKVLAMTRLPRTCQTDLSGEVPAAAVDAAMAVSPGGDQEPRPDEALVAALRAVPQTVRPSMEGSWDDESVEKDNYFLYLEALIASLDERIASLKRVLEAPDDDYAEMAAALAALARSKAYPKLEEWRPFEEVSTRETYRSVLGGGVLPREEACVLALYRDLLNGGEPGEAECSTSTGEETVDKEELRIELEIQKMCRQRIAESDRYDYPGRVSDEFVNRERPSGQPSKDLVKKLSEMEIYLVGKGGIFRKSFSRLESEVICSMTKPQRICLVLLKHCAKVTRSRLCSYELKTAMMWVCERRASELWTWDGMLESMMAVLDFLQECAEQGDLRCYFYREINLWEMFHQERVISYKGLPVLRLRVQLPRAIQLLLAGLLSSSQAPLMRHLLNLPLDAQQMLWCCWKRRVDDPYPTGWREGKVDLVCLCCLLYPAAVEGRLWSERFLDTFRWESLPARCRETDWFAEHGWDTDSEGEEEHREDTDSEREEEEHREDKDEEGEEEDREDKDGEGEEEDRKYTDSEGEEEEDRKDTDGEGEEEGAVTGAMKTGSGSGDTADTAEQGREEARKRDPDIDEERADYISLDGQTAPDSKLAGQAISNSASLDGHTTSDSINLDCVTTSDSSV
ncbi:hypothetical protein FJT64_019887 [Amphibalanus amphitrite]|uniref:Mab-21-like HhH/H2TH-like domain-containing protein n=1 Tax=Amphibalanus amphitrite TaxID=1232801 RepID=A0A6A4WYZ4_AMPAM|nr:hypothetical protein FJT64_019887 [Amphibalanus amphitrite]